MKLNELLIIVSTSIVNELKRVIGITRLANSRLENTATFELNSTIGAANRASKEGFGHLGYNGRETDDHTGDSDKLVDVARVERSHAHELVYVIGTHADVELVLWVFREVELFHGRVERLHHFDWVAHELFVQLDVEVLQVAAVEVEERLF